MLSWSTGSDSSPTHPEFPVFCLPQWTPLLAGVLCIIWLILCYFVIVFLCVVIIFVLLFCRSFLSLVKEGKD